MKKNRLLLFSIIFFASLCAVTLSCTNRQDAEKSDKPFDKVTLGIAAETLSAPLIIAQEKGYFAAEGLDVSIKEYAFGKLALEAMLRDEVDFATVAETPLVMNSFRRDDFSVIAQFVYNYDDSKIIVRSDRGIDKISDLKDKKIGATFGTSTQFVLDLYLTYAGLTAADVIKVNISQKDMPAALMKGTVDAVTIFDPYGYEALKLMKDNAKRFPTNEIFKETFNLAASKGILKRQPEAPIKILRATDKAITFIRQDKRESIAILVRKFNMDEKYLSDTFDEYIFGLSLDHSLLISFEDVARWAIKNNLTDKKRVPNYLSYFYIDALKAVKPDAVTIIK